MCPKPLETWSDVASYKHNALKIEEVPPCDFQVSLACSEYSYLFHSCGPDVDATKNY